MLTRNIVSPQCAPSCWICGSAKSRPVIPFNDWIVFKCTSCGFHFAEGGEPVVLESHYNEEYFRPLVERDQQEKWAEIYADRLSLFRQRSPNGKLLEAGAGASSFAVAAAAAGFEVTVVDGAPWAIKHLCSYNNINGWVADLNALTLPSGTYGAIHCSHVLEHLNTPRRFLETCFDSLAIGGVMHLSFPAYESTNMSVRNALYHLGIANYPYNYQAPDHLSYFGMACIRKTLLSVGFEILQLRRTKFTSLQHVFTRMNQSGSMRRIGYMVAKAGGFVTRRVGFYRDLEILVQRPERATN